MIIFLKTHSKLQHAVSTYLAAHLSLKSETDEIRKYFVELDTSKDGTLSIEELKKGLQSMKTKLVMTDKEIQNLITKFDVNNSGAIDYSEFLTGTVNQQLLANDKNLRIAFSLFDKVL